MNYILKYKIKTCFSDCTELPTSWTNLETINTTFPVKAGSEVQVRCDEYAGYTNHGDETVTCVVDYTYIYSVEPQCVMGMYKFVKIIKYSKYG